MCECYKYWNSLLTVCTNALFMHATWRKQKMGLLLQNKENEAFKQASVPNVKPGLTLKKILGFRRPDMMQFIETYSNQVKPWRLRLNSQHLKILVGKFKEKLPNLINGKAKDRERDALTGLITRKSETESFLIVLLALLIKTFPNLWEQLFQVSKAKPKKFFLREF